MFERELFALSQASFFLFFKLTVAQGLRSNSSLGLTEGLLDLFVFLIGICLSVLSHTQHVRESSNEIKAFMLCRRCKWSVAVRFVSLALSCSHFYLWLSSQPQEAIFRNVCRPVFAAGVYEEEEEGLAGVRKEKQQLHLCTKTHVDGILGLITR